MRITLYGNGSAGNHGCEAIIRGTVALMGDDNHYIIQSDNVDEDRQYGLAALADIFPAVQDFRRDFRFIKAYLKLKLTGNYVDMDGLRYLPAIRAISGQADIAFSVGGDNYCYGNAEMYAYLNRAYRRQGIKTVLWGCSVEPEVAAQSEVAADLAQYNLIVARESITYEAVRQAQKNTVLMPDPAFFMEPKPCELDERWNTNNVIGINISPMIVSNETVSGMAYENYRNLMAYIIENSDSYIALIPHVVWDRNDDRKVLRRLYDDFNQDSRLILVEDHAALELKYIISKCRMFVGARTHATIAAYSSGVPTLVVGYSVKARGIARDLFGTEENYVLPVQQLAAPGQLTEAFRWLALHEQNVRNHLISSLPKYLSKSKDLQKYLAMLG